MNDSSGNGTLGASEVLHAGQGPFDRNSSAAPESGCDVAVVANESALSLLVRALQQHDSRRLGRCGPGDDDGHERLLQACCLTLIVGPQDLGQELVGSVIHGQILAELTAADQEALPEARACRLWLQYAIGQKPDGATEEFQRLATQDLWEPVQGLVYRALASLGQRRILGETVYRVGKFRLIEAEALLEATGGVAPDIGWPQRLEHASGEHLPVELQLKWQQLLNAEFAIAEALPCADESALVKLANPELSESSRSNWQWDARRLAQRATSALIRHELASGRCGSDLLDHSIARELPVWELLYLRGLSAWRLGRTREAVALLEESCSRNLSQTGVRVALASLTAEQSVDEALACLEFAERTHSSLVTRAALLARAGRYSEAKDVLPPPDALAPLRDPLRWTWFRGRERLEQQRVFLTGALAERRGDWRGAARVWMTAAGANIPKTLVQSRQAVNSLREMRALPVAAGRRRSELDQRLQWSANELRSAVLVGDALLFRAAAVAEARTASAIRDVQTLLRQRRWCSREQQIGGGRLIAIGDILLRLGQPSAAIDAYERAGSKFNERLKDRLSLAVLLNGLRETSGVGSAELGGHQPAPTNAWVQAVQAIGFRVQGKLADAHQCQKAAEELGAPEAVRQVLRAICGETITAIPEATQKVLRLPVRAFVALRLMAGKMDDPCEMRLFVEAFNDEWTGYCPGDPEIIARRLLADWCRTGDWDRALQFVESLSNHAVPCSEFGPLVMLARGLAAAAAGRVEEAKACTTAADTKWGPYQP